MTSLAPRIAAHLIVGAREEPFLGALLESIAPWVTTLIVQDNSGDRASANRQVIERSVFRQSGRILVDEAPFTDFATARNRCLALHQQHQCGEWVAFVDADEVHHHPTAARIAERLHTVPASVATIDAYTYHFFQSFDWYMSIERRMMLFRWHAHLVWERPVHEQLRGINGERWVLPYVYAHYGHVLSAQRHAGKLQQYASLGDSEAVVPDTLDERIRDGRYFAAFWPRLLRFRGEHPEAVRPLIREMQSRYAADFTRNDEFRVQYRGGIAAFLDRAYWRIMYDVRWRTRWMSAAARCVLSPE